MLLGPGVNIRRSPLCGRNFEYFSEDPYLAGRMAAAIVDGLQSQQVGGCVKHFAANNQETDRMRVSADVDERTLAAAIAEVPSAQVSAAGSLPTVVDLMAETKIVASKSAARRAIAEGGAYLNNRKVASEDAVPGPADLLHGRYLIFRVGKRTAGAIEVVPADGPRTE